MSEEVEKSLSDAVADAISKSGGKVNGADNRGRPLKQAEPEKTSPEKERQKQAEIASQVRHSTLGHRSTLNEIAETTNDINALEQEILAQQLTIARTKDVIQKSMIVISNAKRRKDELENMVTARKSARSILVGKFDNDEPEGNFPF